MTFYLSKNLSIKNWELQFKGTKTTYFILDQYPVKRTLGGSNPKIFDSDVRSRYPTINEGANLYASSRFLNVMIEKIDKIAQYLNLNNLNYHCTLMIIHNLLEVHYLRVPCNAKILEEGSVFCMHTSEAYYQVPDKVRGMSEKEEFSVLQGNNTEEGGKDIKIRAGHNFTCDDNTFISTYSLCDGLKDCQQNEDERDCPNYHDIWQASKLCDEILHRKVTSLEWICPKKYLSIDITQDKSCQYHTKNKFTLDFITQNNYSENGYLQDKNNSYCVYEPSQCDITGVNGYGRHLVDCSHHMCSDIYFKCPGFYCLPWRFVCNNKWDCPGGVDEVACEQTSFPRDVQM